MSNFLQKEYGLKLSPFKQKSALHEQLPMWVDREDETRKWQHILQDSIATPNTNFIALLVGDYGMGKSLSLLKIIEEADPKAHFPIYLSLLAEQKPSRPGLDFIFRILKQVDFSKFRVDNNQLGHIKEINPEVHRIFELIFFGNSEEKELALAYLRGEISPSATQLKTMKILRKMNDVDQILEYLIGLLFIMKISGFSNFLIAVDEFEYLFSFVPKNSQPIYLALFRRLYDLRIRIPETLRATTSNMTFFCAISADGERRWREQEKIERGTGGPTNPLKRRIAFNVITLTSLTRKASIELIEKRLRLNRSSGKFESEPLIPFTEEFAVFIHKLSEGRPETIIDRCDNVLDAGLERRLPRLTKEFAIEVFQERGIGVGVTP